MPIRLVLLVSLLLIAGSALPFDDTGWKVTYQENFDGGNYVASDDQLFGTDDWLIYDLHNGGEIVVANGYAQLNAADFWMAGLIRSTHSLPDEYKVRTKIGYINYDLENYEQADYDNPDFDDHDGYHENGMYFLTVTDDTCVGDECAENWWHYHRKMVIDIDNHLNYGAPDTTHHPVFMVYMAPEMNSGGNLLRTWTGSYWDKSPWNWSVAYTYSSDTWYYAELEKKDGFIVLRLYDASQNILEETDPVSVDSVNAMYDPVEFLYVGEPHTDDYEGDVRVDEITLLEVDDDESVGETHGQRPEGFWLSQNHPNPFNPSTTIDYELGSRSNVSITIYNVMGEQVKLLIDEIVPRGSHSVNWDGTDANSADVSTGVYFYRVEIGDYTESRKMMLLK
jgi:hypothetical protein